MNGVEIMQKFVPFFQGEKRIITERLAEYFEQNGLETKIHYDEKLDSYILSVPEDKDKDARKLYQEFYFKERERVEREEKNKDFLHNYDEANMFAKTTLDEIPKEAVSDPEEDTADDIENTLYTAADIRENEDSLARPDNSDSYADSANSGGKLITAKSDDTDRIDYGSLTNYNGQSYGVGSGDETEQADQTDAEDTEDEKSDGDMATLKRLLSGSGNYVFKSEKYRDYIGSFYIFLLLGIGGIIFVILNIAKVLNLLNGIFPNLIMAAFFILFIYEGISAGIKAKELKSEAEEENKLTEKINEWLKNTVTKEFLDSIGRNGSSEELDYIKKVDTIRDMLLKEFGDINTDYLDRLIEEYYSKNFDKTQDD